MVQNSQGQNVIQICVTIVKRIMENIYEAWTICVSNTQFERVLWLRKMNWFHPYEGAVSLQNGVDWSGTGP